MVHWTTWLMWMGIGYVAGSTPFGLWIGLIRGVDIRKIGSGNVGATNVGRMLGRQWGLMCFFFDLCKGLVPVAVYGAWFEPMQADGSAIAAGQWIAIGVAAVLGHVFSFWLKFRGGKGAATGMGAVLGVWPVLTVPAIACGLLWFIITKMTGYVSLASVIAAIALPIGVAISTTLFGLSSGQVGVFTGVTGAMGLIVVLRHRSNLTRLRQGTESKVAWAKRG